ncbi:hypothetical protein NKI39_22150 [Mesorhizobium sp. M0664]|uniref:hypothetical protein n=2 Tax=unclassified Mesorhizobium TaxID=325217 RepID=UPI00333AC2BC
MPFVDNFVALMNERGIAVDSSVVPDPEIIEGALNNVQLWWDELNAAVRDGFDEGGEEFAVCFILGEPEINVAPELRGHSSSLRPGRRSAPVTVAANYARGPCGEPKYLTWEVKMAIEEFAECYAEHVGTTVDAVINDLRQLGADNIRAFVSWFRGLSEADRALVGIVASTATGVLLKILTKGVGEFIGVCLVGLLGGASWALLVRSCIDCEERL